MGVPRKVAEHAAQGRYVKLASGDAVFVREEGPADGAVVVLVHGVPSSSLLYAGMMPELASKGLRAVAFDFPGLGLSDKPSPSQRDYSWLGLKDAMAETLAVLELESFHLVIHDIGGPIAAWYAVENKEKVLSITILDTLLDLTHFSKPFPMNLFPLPVVGRLAMATLFPWAFKFLMGFIGVYDKKAFGTADAKAWVHLLKREGGTDTFLAIMRGFEMTKELQAKIKDGLQSDIPLQVVWGSNEVSIPRKQLTYLQKNLPITETHFVKGRHFLQLDCAVEISDHVVNFVATL